jgi:arylsulfatase A-like enzyme
MHPLNGIEVPAGYHPFDLEDLPSRGRLMSWSDRHHVDIVKRGLWKEAIQGYFAAMSYVDEQIGRVLDALEASGHADNTIVVFFSDNGMHLGEKNHWLKYTLWEQATRVFLSVYVPGYPRQTIDSPVSLVDLYPTLATLSGIGRPEHELDGVDLTSLLAGEVQERGRPVLSTWGRGNHAIRDERYRYIRYRNGEEELYDHFADGHEWDNLADDPQFDSVKARLAASLPESDAPNTRKLNPPQSELQWDELMDR